jgi:hypothetical protein
MTGEGFLETMNWDNPPLLQRHRSIKDAILSLPKIGFEPCKFDRHGRNSLHARNAKEVKPNLYGITEKTAFEDKS